MSRRPPTVEALVTRIHDVNPTARNLSAAEVKRRYAEKSALQSELIERFPEALIVERDATQPDEFVVLRLVGQGTFGVDAAHARVDALSDAAASWVRHQLDLAEHHGPGGPAQERDPRRSMSGSASTRGSRTAASGSAGASGPTGGARSSAGSSAAGSVGSDAVDALAAGHAALAEYDFEVAEAHFRAAFKARGGDLPSALALLGFLVENLAADLDALRAAEHLSPDARSHLGVRALVGLAAARVSSRADATSWLGATHAPGLAPAWARLCEGSIAVGDLEAAAHDLGRVEACDPACPALPDLRRALASASAASVEQDAKDLQADLASTGPEAPTEALARRAEAILSRHPANAAARAVLRELAAREREAERVRLVHAAEAARRAGRHEAELATLRALRQHTGDATLDARLAEVAALAEADTHERQAARVVASLWTGADEDGIVAFLALDDITRALVRTILARGGDTEPERGPSASASTPPDLRRPHDARRSLDLLDDAATLSAWARPKEAARVARVIAEAVAAARAGELGVAASLLAPHQALAPLVERGRQVLEAHAADEARRADARWAARLDELRDAVLRGDLQHAERTLRAGHPPSSSASAAGFAELERTVGLRRRGLALTEKLDAALRLPDPIDRYSVLGELDAADDAALADRLRHERLAAREAALATLRVHHLDGPVDLGHLRPVGWGADRSVAYEPASHRVFHPQGSAGRLCLYRIDADHGFADRVVVVELPHRDQNVEAEVTVAPGRVSCLLNAELVLEFDPEDLRLHEVRRLRWPIHEGEAIEGSTLLPSGEVWGETYSGSHGRPRHEARVLVLLPGGESRHFDGGLPAAHFQDDRAFVVCTDGQRLSVHEPRGRRVESLTVPAGERFECGGILPDKTLIGFIGPSDTDGAIAFCEIAQGQVRRAEPPVEADTHLDGLAATHLLPDHAHCVALYGSEPGMGLTLVRFERRPGERPSAALALQREFPGEIWLVHDALGRAPRLVLDRGERWPSVPLEAATLEALTDASLPAATFGPRTWRLHTELWTPAPEPMTMSDVYAYVRSTEFDAWKLVETDRDPSAERRAKVEAMPTAPENDGRKALFCAALAALAGDWEAADRHLAVARTAAGAPGEHALRFAQVLAAARGAPPPADAPHALELISRLRECAGRSPTEVVALLDVPMLWRGYSAQALATLLEAYLAVGDAALTPTQRLRLRVGVATLEAWIEGPAGRDRLEVPLPEIGRTYPALELALARLRAEVPEFSATPRS